LFSNTIVKHDQIKLRISHYNTSDVYLSFCLTTGLKLKAKNGKLYIKLTAVATVVY